MEIPDETLERIRDVLRQATALVVVDGRPIGTAFFVTDRVLLTCEHVIRGHPDCEVEPFGRARRPAAVLDAPDAEADLALLSVEPDGAEPPQPCVALDTLLHDGGYSVAGFPRAEGFAAGLEVFGVTGHPRQALDGTDQVLQIEAGRQVTWGNSGGPVLSLRTGAVVGVVRLSNDPQDALGGGAIPMSRAAQSYEQVRRLLAEPPPAVRQWRDVLGRSVWQALGKSWDIAASVDLRVSGARKRWKISMDQTAGSEDVTGPDLGEDVAEALFRWAQRRRIRSKEEVELLGRLLASALIPGSVAEHLRAVSGADSVLVRLHVEHGNDLADIPWELAAVPGKRDSFLAADSAFRFVRVIDASDPAGRPVPTDTVDVLGVMAQPPRWRFPVVFSPNGGEPYEWPKFEEQCLGFRQSVEGGAFKLDLRAGPQKGDLRTALESRPFQVLHYVGVGRLGRTGEPLIAVVDDDGDAEDWEELTPILDLASTRGVRLVVLELMLPPDGRDYDPITPSTLSNVIKGSVNGLVLTHLPVHPKQIRMFNKPFYEALRAGESIETAVQRGRRALGNSNPVEDAAGFGWFTVATGVQSDIGLVARFAEDRTEKTTRQPTDDGGGRAAGGPIRTGGDVLSF